MFSKSLEAYWFRLIVPLYFFLPKKSFLSHFIANIFQKHMRFSFLNKKVYEWLRTLLEKKIQSNKAIRAQKLNLDNKEHRIESPTYHFGVFKTTEDTRKAPSGVFSCEFDFFFLKSDCLCLQGVPKLNKKSQTNKQKNKETNTQKNYKTPPYLQKTNFSIRPF